MMSVQDYAEEMNFTVQDVLNKCKELGIKINSKDDMLDDEAIIMLDNCMNLIDSDTELDFDEADTLDEVIDDIMDYDNIKSINNSHTVSKEKVKKQKDKEASNKDYAKMKKEMYKNKEKLTSNTSSNDDSIVLYKENMTVGNLANVLGVSGSELVAKLISLGLLLSLTQTIDFDTALIVASE